MIPENIKTIWTKLGKGFNNIFEYIFRGGGSWIGILIVLTVIFVFCWGIVAGSIAISRYNYQGTITDKNTGKVYELKCIDADNVWVGMDNTVNFRYNGQNMNLGYYNLDLKQTKNYNKPDNCNI